MTGQGSGARLRRSSDGAIPRMLRILRRTALRSGGASPRSRFTRS